jgi:hypothetical protein
MANHGFYKPRYPQKYVGDPENIQFRSSWEAAFMQFADLNPNIVAWGSEEISIPYIKPTDKKIHRYIPDFWIKVKDRNGAEKRYIIEIKPLKETVHTKKTSMRDALVIGINYAKWEAAKAFCDKHNMGFKVLTERELFPKGTKK